MKFKKIIITSLVLITIGITMVIAAFAFSEIDFDDFHQNVISKTYDINGEFDSIDIRLNVSDLNLYLSNDETNKAICLEKDNITFSVEVKENVLVIEEKYNFTIYNLGETEISLFLNKKDYEKINIETDTGDISISDQFVVQDLTIKGTTNDVSLMNKVEQQANIKLTTGDLSLYRALINNLDVEVSTGEVDIKESLISNNAQIISKTGDVEINDTKVNREIKIIGNTTDISLENVECNLIDVSASTGDVKLSNVVANESIILITDTGDIKLKSSDANNITIETTTGDVRGSLLSDKIFIVRSNTGHIIVPETISGGKCKITTDTGDIYIEIE